MVITYCYKIASDLGVNAALAADFLYTMQMAGQAVVVGKTKWIHCPAKALTEVFPHMGRKAAARALETLVEHGYAFRSVPRIDPFDGSYSYCLTESALKTLTDPERYRPV